MQGRGKVRSLVGPSTSRWVVVSGAICTLLVISGCRLKGDGADSTVAPDRRQFPRGEVIPPAGFGVDLVKRNLPTQSDIPTGDKTVMPASSGR